MATFLFLSGNTVTGLHRGTAASAAANCPVGQTVQPYDGPAPPRLGHAQSLTYVNGTFALTGGPDLATAKAAALAQIDRAAEAARQRFLTPGAGQAVEYAATLADARAAAAAPDPLVAASYPWLVAEQAALAAAGTTQDLRAVANAVLAADARWQTAGVAIKQTRRAAKMAVAAAASVAAVDAIISGLAWPSA